ncbi:MAG: hypothetical protein ACRDJV_06360 [Actinomycetota bacterium]
MIKRILVALAAAGLLVSGLPLTAWAGPSDDVCSIEVLGWRPC